ncbi:hypothetical protein HS088_TW01G00832 [Tripterygium wilfordii]|uniref:Uncharacterized protein n=1 Tax=Tripterygium wilfordii TaxID=458696 RepID=A0A7J7E392_TRIWF|nr:hypothetical protein HS088_TW01G00832 [Tripterygium wilfordii]
MAQIKSLSTFLFLVLIFFHEIHSIEGRRLVKFGIENQLPKSWSLRALRELVEHKSSKLHGDDISSATVNADDANAPMAPALPALTPPTAPAVPAFTPPTPGRVENFRPTTPGHSPGVGHSIQN